jgi:putative PIN family toxin of toxin-antitoxin system
MVLDTNVLIAAFIAQGLCSDLLEHCVQQHTVVTSDFILTEFRETLIGKFKFTPEEANAAATLLLSKMVVVKPIDLPTPICRDPDDDTVLATAVAGNCDCIVTGDNDLLVLKHFADVGIVSPADFVEYEATRPS